MVLPFLFSFSVSLSSKSVQSRIADIYIYIYILYIYIVCANFVLCSQEYERESNRWELHNWTFQIHKYSLSPPQEDEGCHYPSNTFGGCVYGRAKKQSDQNICQHWQYLYYFNSLEVGLLLCCFHQLLEHSVKFTALK